LPDTEVKGHLEEIVLDAHTDRQTNRHTGPSAITADSLCIAFRAAAADNIENIAVVV